MRFYFRLRLHDRDDLEWLTERLIDYREGKLKMALEIKGLKTNMLKVAQRIERLNAKAIAFDELGGTLESGLDDITAQVKAHDDDLTFAATMLGNSTTLSNEPAKPVAAPPVASTQAPAIPLTPGS